PLALACTAPAGQSDTQSHIAIAEAANEMLPSQNRSKQINLASAQRIESAIAPLTPSNRFAKPIQQPISASGIIHHTQCFQIAQVGSLRHLSVAIGVGHSFGHRKPAFYHFSLAQPLSANPKFVWLIDYCFDP